MSLTLAYRWLFSFAFSVVGICLLFSIIRSARGPAITDRLLAVNANTTMVVALILWLTVFLGEDWLADVALVYVLLGTVGTAVLAKVYTQKEISPSRGASRSKDEDSHG